jgi:hypothetical protein
MLKLITLNGKGGDATLSPSFDSSCALCADTIGADTIASTREKKINRVNLIGT